MAVRVRRVWVWRRVGSWSLRRRFWVGPSKHLKGLGVGPWAQAGLARVASPARLT